jgi:ferric-dicitrate binding protein FerR (iron transport regulator)/thioredoxin-like negative regulator of GroEL
MKPECRHLEGHLGNALGDAERAAFEAHLPTCDDCRPRVEAWQRFADAYRARMEPLTRPPSAPDVQRLLRKARKAEPARPALRVLAIAAVAAALVAIAAWWLRPAPELSVVLVAENGTQAPVAEEVAAGAKRQTVLIGTDRVGLAPRSAIRVVEHNRRSVRLRLESGAVAAKVTHRERGQTFAVEAGEVLVTVVGTQFRVTRLEGGARVDVVEGIVEVRSANGAQRVEKGHTLVVDAAGVKTSELGEAELPELSDIPEVTDAGASVETSTAEPEALEPEVADAGTRLPRPASRHDLERWRRAAVSGRCSEILPELRRVRRENPQRTDALHVLADCLRLAGENREAAREYEQLIQIARPDEADVARILLADLYLQHLEEPASAERVFREYLKRKQPPQLEAAARVKLARALIALKRPREAHAELEHVTKRLPSTPAAVEALELLKTIGDR